MRALVLVLLPVLAHASPFDEMHVEQPELCARGRVTTLWRSSRTPVMAMHDGPEGSTTFEVRSGARSVGKVELPGGGRCLGWSKDVNAYLVGSVHEVGVLLPMPSVELVGEDGKARVTALEREGHAAYALVSNGRFVAFVGFDEKDMMKLFVLDLVTDRQKELGPAPAPPPDERGDRKHRWHWGVDGEEGFVDIEPDVMRFDGDVLRVSYGKDTARARSKQRTVKTFALTR